MAMTRPVRYAVVPAAGFGTRFLPATKAMPKEMLPIVDKPIIQIIVEELVEAGITDIILVTGYHKRAIEDHFDAPSLDLVDNLRLGGAKKQQFLDEVQAIANLANFTYVRQKGPYGNGTPLLNVANLIGDEPFIYTWSDDFIVASPSRFRQLLAVYAQYGSSALAAIRAQDDADYDRYGFAAGPEIAPGVIEATEIVEKPGKAAAPSNLATVSGFVFTPAIFGYLKQAAANLKEGDELYYNDALRLMLADQIQVLAVEIANGRYYDTGNKLEYLKTNLDFALRRPDLGPELKTYLKARLEEDDRSGYDTGDKSKSQKLKSKSESDK